jgi:hypothetical protein
MSNIVYINKLINIFNYLLFLMILFLILFDVVNLNYKNPIINLLIFLNIIHLLDYYLILFIYIIIIISIIFTI